MATDSPDATPSAKLSPAMVKHLRITGLWVTLVVIVIVSIQLALPDVVTVGPTWLVPFMELIGIPVVLLLIFFGGEHPRVVQGAMSAFLVLLVLASVMNAVLLLLSLLNGFTEQGGPLLFAGFGVLIINVLSFGLVYWWADAGGPVLRAEGRPVTPDFLFPQQGMDDMADWKPGLLDYLFTAYTNIIAFSPTDTMPLSKRVKVLFVVQSSTAVLTIVVTLSRAINLIPGGTPPAS
ncbi:MAG: hypothetical protein ACKOMX_09610 [Actinomycetota bacterium]